MNKTEIHILLILRSENARTPFQSITVNDVMETDGFPKLQAGTVRMLFKKLASNGLVKQGARDGRYITYFITQAGIDKIGEIVDEKQ